MRVLVVGSGGREHALSWALSKSPILEKLYAIPGNPGIKELGECIEDVSILDFEGIYRVVSERKIDLVVVGSEEPLVKGLADYLLDRGVKVVGPRSKEAFLEGSKIEAKKFMKRHGIPTASFGTFESFNKAAEALDSMEPPYVIKADGLAYGKGVSIVDSKEEALHVLHDYMIEEKFGEASRRVVIEEFLTGEEFSLFYAVDGTNYVFVGDAKDYKKLYEGDRGPNTGGMGSISPVPLLTPEKLKFTEEKIVKPTIEGLVEEEFHYQGILYFGLIWTADGPYVLEYNVRFGDPETQVLVMRYDFDLLSLFESLTGGTIEEFEVKFRDCYALTVVLASFGYPFSYNRGYEIYGIEEALRAGAVIFHAGTAYKDGKIVTNGGRVLNVTACGKTLEETKSNAYRAAEMIKFEGAYMRRDIGS